ncbi:MAG: DHH family phosphoesterase [Bacteroidota bacterium]
MKPIQEIYPLLTQQPRNIVITTHQKPDADAMGSSLALLHFLKKFGHTVKVISPTNWAKWLDWMPGCDEVIDFDFNRQLANETLEAADWLFCLDFNIFYRTKTMTERLKNLPVPRYLLIITANPIPLLLIMAPAM